MCVLFVDGCEGYCRITVSCERQDSEEQDDMAFTMDGVENLICDPSRKLKFNVAVE